MESLWGFAAFVQEGDHQAKQGESLRSNTIHHDLGQAAVIANRRDAPKGGIVSDDGFLSYSELNHMVTVAGQHLRRRFAVGVGSRIATLLLGGLSPILWLYAIPSSGGVQVALNARWSSREIVAACEDTQPAVLVYSPSFHNQVCQILSKYSRPLSALCCDEALRRMLRRKPLPQADNEGQMRNGSCSIFFTSGTTGQSKGALLSHLNLLIQGRAKLQHVGYDANTVYLHLLPMFHVGGTSSAVAITMARGIHVIDSEAATSFNPERIIALILRHKVTAFAAVPTMLYVLTTTREEPIESVTTILIGGGALDERLRHSICHLFPAAKLIVAYGMTETASSITFTDCTEAAETSASGLVGYPPSHVDIEVIDENGTFIPSNTIGEIITRGPHVMHCYVNRPQETQAVFLRDGWLRTGDLGLIRPDGALFLRGRKKDLIKTGGENVHALEIESILLLHPSVSECSVFGVPHDRFGEIVCAAVVLSPDGSKDTSAATHELKQHCADLLSRYKVPRRFFVRDQLPRNSSGKVLKHVLRASLATARL